MTKPTITKVWVAGLIALLTGFVIAAVGVGLMLGLGGHFQWRGNEIVGFQPDFNALFWTGVGLISGGGLVFLGGVLTQFVAWIGALINTWQLDDKLWFVLLLVLGILRFEFVIMLIYVFAGPDGYAPQKPAAPTAGAKLAPAT